MPVAMQEWISKEERELVVELRTRVFKELPPEESLRSPEDQDANLLRWLRARDLNLDKAEAMLITALKWRKENQMDNFLELDQSVDPFFKEHFQCKILGADKGGRPVFIVPLDEWDFRKALNANKGDGFDKFVTYICELILTTTQKYNKKREPGDIPITQYLAICDVSKFPYGQLLSFSAMRKWFMFAAKYEAYYPEIMYQVCMINCPSYFQLFLNLLKGFLAPRTLGKFLCYSTMADWQKAIESFVDPALIPEQYGGTCKIHFCDLPFDKE